MLKTSNTLLPMHAVNASESLRTIAELEMMLNWYDTNMLLPV